MSALATDLDRPAPTATFAVALLVFVELMFFAGLVSAYIVLRSGFTNWPPAGQPRLPVEITAVNTGILLATGIATLTWGRAAQNPKEISRSLSGVFFGGALFVAIQGAEWVRLVKAGLSAYNNVYGALFGVIVGAHAIHVVGGLLALAGFASVARARRLTPASWDGLRALRLYWLFVVLLWPVLYALVYLW